MEGAQIFQTALDQTFTAGKFIPHRHGSTPKKILSARGRCGQLSKQMLLLLEKGRKRQMLQIHTRDASLRVSATQEQTQKLTIACISKPERCCVSVQRLFLLFSHHCNHRIDKDKNGSRLHLHRHGCQPRTSGRVTMPKNFPPRSLVSHGAPNLRRVFLTFFALAPWRTLALRM